MAEFNPQLPDPNVDDFSRRSEGFRPVPTRQAPPAKQFSTFADRSGEFRARGASIFNESVGKLFGQAVEATDYVVKSYIQNTLTDQTNAIRDEYGVGAMAIQNTDFGGEVVGQPPRPEQLNAAGQELEGLTAAYQSGRLKESQYWARLESMVRQMKTRFPGYRDDVDSMVSKLTGATPANVLRRLILQEAEDANAALGDEAKNTREFTEEMVKNGSWFHIFPGREPGTVPYQELLVGRANYEKEFAGYNADAARLKAEQDLDKNNTERAVDTLTGQHSQIFASSRDRILKGAGFTNGWDDFTALLAEQSRNPTSENQARLLSAYRLLRDGTQNAMFEHENRYYAGKPGTPALVEEERAKARNPIITQLDAIGKAIQEGDTSVAAMHTNILKFSSDEVGRRFIDSNQYFKLNYALEQTFGREWLAEYTQKQPQFGVDLQGAMASYSAMEILNGTSTPMAELREAQKQKIPFGAERVSNMIDQALLGLTSDKAPPAAKQQYAQTLFSMENRALVASLVKEDPNLAMAVYRKFLTPEVQQEMVAMKDQNPQAWNNYKNWAVASFDALFKEDIDNLNEVIVYTDNLDINYDSENNNLKVQLFKTNSRLSDDQRMQQANVDRLVARMNGELELLKPVLEADNRDGSEVILNLLTNAGFDVSDRGTSLVKQGSFGRRLLNSIRQSIADMEAAQKEPTGQGLTPSL